MASPNTHQDAHPLPYFRSATELPGPLPTLAEIESATTIFPSIHNGALRRTVLVNDLFVVKYGPYVFENEGRALLLVEGVSQVPAPRLFAMYRVEGKLYIVMEFMKGQQLSELWPSLLEEEKVFLVRQLRHTFDSLRSMPSPGYYGGAFGGPVPHPYFFSPEKDPAVTGPFSREEDVCQALVLRSTRNWEELGRRGWMSEFFARHAAAVLNGHESVFTHSDFQQKNILVQQVPGMVETLSPIQPGIVTREFEVTAIVDWENAGWFPSYFQYAICFSHFSWNDDWPEKMEEILDPYVAEAPLLRVIAHDLDM